MSKQKFYDYRLLLLRHGQTEANRGGCFLGRLDQPLTPVGKAQAQNLGRLLADEDLDVIYTSPLARASATAEAVADAKGLEPILEPDLIEQDFGAWDGLNFAQVKQRFPQDFKAWWADPGQPPTDGEHLNAVSQRVHGFFKQLDPQKGQTIGLVGHGSAFQALLCCLYSIPTRGLWPFRLQNATVTEVQFLHGMPTMTRMSWAGDHKEN